MIKKVFAISMVVLMLAGIFISVANFTSSDLDAADIWSTGHWEFMPLPFPYGAGYWECTYCTWRPNCTVGGSGLL